MASSVTSLAARSLVHLLAHELAASPKATSRLLSSAFVQIIPPLQQGVYYNQCSEIHGTNHASTCAPGYIGRLLSPIGENFSTSSQ